MSLLVVTRREDESIHIGNDIRVIVVKICGNKVRIAVDAPKSTVVLRGELIEKARLEREGNDDNATNL